MAITSKKLRVKSENKTGNKDETLPEKFIARLYKYPLSDSIKINESDLTLKLRDFKQAIERHPCWNDFLLLVPAWAILFTSTFHDFRGISGEKLRGAYFAFLFLGSLNVIIRLFRSMELPDYIAVWINADHKPEKLIKDIKEVASKKSN